MEGDFETLIKPRESTGWFVGCKRSVTVDSEFVVQLDLEGVRLETGLFLASVFDLG